MRKRKPLFQRSGIISQERFFFFFFPARSRGRMYGFNQFVRTNDRSVILTLGKRNHLRKPFQPLETNQASGNRCERARGTRWEGG